MYSTADFRTGLKIELDGKPFTVIEFLHVKPGKGGAFVRTKLKNMITGQVLEKTFRAGEKVHPQIYRKKKCNISTRTKESFVLWIPKALNRFFYQLNS